MFCLQFAKKSILQFARIVRSLNKTVKSTQLNSNFAATMEMVSTNCVLNNHFQYYENYAYGIERLLEDRLEFFIVKNQIHCQHSRKHHKN